MRLRPRAPFSFKGDAQAKEGASTKVKEGDLAKEATAGQRKTQEATELEGIQRGELEEPVAVSVQMMRIHAGGGRAKVEVGHAGRELKESVTDSLRETYSVLKTMGDDALADQLSETRTGGVGGRGEVGRGQHLRM